MEGKLEA
jgi:hypothetical protein